MLNANGWANASIIQCHPLIDAEGYKKVENWSLYRNHITDLRRIRQIRIWDYI